MHLRALLPFALLFTPALASAQTPTTHGIAISSMDPSVKPGDDFYRYSNGGWLARTNIPADRDGVGVFSVLRDQSLKQTRSILEDAASEKPAPGSNTQKIADLYHSYMNQGAIESRHLAPLAEQLKAIAAISDKTALAQALGSSVRADVDPLNNTNFHTDNLFGLWVAPGFSDSAHYHAYLLQGGLELPDRDYYLSSTESMQTIRKAYVAHVATMLQLAGLSDAETRAHRVFALEEAIAKTHWSLADDQEVAKANNLWQATDFPAKAPGLDWPAFFHGAGLEQVSSFVVWQPSAFTGEALLVGQESLDSWKDLLAYHVIETYADTLPAKLADQHFALTGKLLSGTLQQPPRWQRAIALLNTELGDAIGPEYAKRYLSPQARAKAQALVANIIAVYRKRLEAIEWMAPETKKEAIAKLDALYVGIGYPESWQDYSRYDVKPDDLFGNVWRGALFRYRMRVARIGRPVDREEWAMTPQTVNAVNLPLQNALNFPAAILQPPFFDPQAPDAVNFGAIGSVIGHEISHTFDTEGSAFDSQGRMRDWWTRADFDHFAAATAKLAAQYDSYHPFPDLSVNGKQTLAEDVADVAGVSAAYDAYRASLNGSEPPADHGFNADQQFFIAFGQNWAVKQRPPSYRKSILTDSHAPGPYRALTVRNLDSWYTAFQVQPGQSLYLPEAERVKIW